MATRPASDTGTPPAPRRETGPHSAQLDLFAEPPQAVAVPAPPPPAVRAPAAPPTAPALQLPPGARWHEVVAEGQRIRFVLQRSRRRTIGFLIGDDGLRVTAPRWSAWPRSTARSARRRAGSCPSCTNGSCAGNAWR